MPTHPPHPPPGLLMEAGLGGGSNAAASALRPASPIPFSLSQSDSNVPRAPARTASASAPTPPLPTRFVRRSSVRSRGSPPLLSAAESGRIPMS
eukprot:881861-Prymnesium_polylepis.1